MMNMNEVHPEESRGSMLLASVMTVSFGVLMFLGVVSSTMSEKLRTDQVVQTATALQLAHSGIERALWEINYSDANYSAATDGTQANWTSLGGNQFRYTGLANTTVTVTDDATNPATITSRGQSTGIARTVSVKVPARGAAPAGEPGIFDQALYARSSSVHLYATGAGSVNLSGYDSGDSSATPPEVIIMSDWRPFRHDNWNQASTDGNALVAPIILEGNITAGSNIKLMWRTPTAGEFPAPVNHHYAANVSGAAVKGGASFTGTTEQVSRDVPIPEYVAQAGTEVDPLDWNTYWIHPDALFGMGFNAATDVVAVCPGESITTTELTAQDMTVVLGCTAGSGGPYTCNSPTKNFKDGWGDPHPCTGADPSAKVTISTGVNDPSYQGAYALQVAGTGKIVINSPADIYYNYPGSVGGFSISGGGIENQVMKSCGGACQNPDPSKLIIYGGAHNLADSSVFSTTTGFHGGIFNPVASVTFNNPGGTTFTFSGSLNAKKIDTTSTVNLRWDAALKDAYPGAGGEGGGGEGDTCDTSAHNCLPTSGTWSMQNN